MHFFIIFHTLSLDFRLLTIHLDKTTQIIPSDAARKFVSTFLLGERLLLFFDRKFTAEFIGSLEK